MPMTREEVEAAMKIHGGINKTAAALHVSSRQLRRALNPEAFDYELAGHDKSTPPKPAFGRHNCAAKAKSLGDFRAIYDKDFIIPKKIKEGLAALGSEGWDYEAQFAKLAGVGLTDLAAYRDSFAAYVVVLGRDGRRAWAGTAATAEAMRAML